MTDNEWSEGIIESFWSRCGAQLLVWTHESIRLVDFNDGTTERTLCRPAHGSVSGLGFTEKTWWIVSRSDSALLWQSGINPEPIELAGKGITDVTYALASPDGCLVACISERNRLGVWSTQDGRRRCGLQIQAEGEGLDDVAGAEIEHVKWSGDSRYLAIQPGFPLSEILVVDVQKGRTKKILRY